MANTKTIYTAKTPSAIVGGTAHGTTETQFLDAAGNPLKIYIPGSSTMDGKPFQVVVAGRVTGGTTVNFTLNLAHGVSATYSSNTTIATSGAVAVNSASTNFLMIVYLIWDSTSLILQGCSGDGWWGTTPTIHTKAVTTARTAVDLTVDGVGFTVTGTFSGSNANNAAYITSLSLNVL